MENNKLTEATKNNDSFEATAVRVSGVSIIGNLILSVFKLAAGIFAHSSAMVSDAIHSASDVLSSFVVVIGVRISVKESDTDHQYGHDRFEPIAAIILAVILMFTGLMIGKSALEKLVSGNYDNLPMPGILALIAAIVSIAAKEGMYRYTAHYAKKIGSGSLMADAWHHRSDAFSSIGSLIGVLGARLGFLWLDPLAGLIICFFIIKASYDIFRGAVDQLVDHACSPEMEKEIKDYAASQPEVLGVKRIQTREFGNKIYVDMDIFADPLISLEYSEHIRKQVHDAIEKQFPRIKHIMVRVRPYERF